MASWMEGQGNDGRCDGGSCYEWRVPGIAMSGTYTHVDVGDYSYDRKDALPKEHDCEAAQNLLVLVRKVER